MNGRIKSYIAELPLLVILCVLVYVCNICAKQTIAYFTPLSLRYDSPLGGEEALAARKYAVGKGDEKRFWPTFWREQTSEFTAGWNTASAPCIVYSGDAFLVWPERYIYGTAPSAEDPAGCALSEALAFRLFGVKDASGRTLEADGELLTVRGVFKGESELALVSRGMRDIKSWYNAVEMYGIQEDDAVTIAVASGIGTPSLVLKGEVLISVANALTAFPLTVVVIFGLAQLIRLLRRLKAPIPDMAVFTALLLFALTLPRLVSSLPGWITPNRLSDLSHWSSLPAKVGSGIRNFIAAAHSKRDAEGIILLLRQAVLCFLTAIIAVFSCCKWTLKINNRKFSETPDISHLGRNTGTG